MATPKLENYLRTYRKRSGLSQREVAFLLGCEDGAQICQYEKRHHLPPLETALAFEVPLYQLFYEGKEPPEPSHPGRRKAAEQIVWGTTRKEIHFWKNLRGLLARMKEPHRRLLLTMAQKMARR